MNLDVIVIFDAHRKALLIGAKHGIEINRGQPRFLVKATHLKIRLCFFLELFPSMQNYICSQEKFMHKFSLNMHNFLVLGHRTNMNLYLKSPENIDIKRAQCLPIYNFSNTNQMRNAES